MIFMYYEMEVWAIDWRDLKLSRFDCTNHKVVEQKIQEMFPYLQDKGSFDTSHKMYLFHYDKKYIVRQDLFHYYMRQDVYWCPRIYREEIPVKYSNLYFDMVQKLSGLEIKKYYLTGLEQHENISYRGSPF